MLDWCTTDNWGNVPVQWMNLSSEHVVVNRSNSVLGQGQLVLVELLVFTLTGTHASSTQSATVHTYVPESQGTPAAPLLQPL